MPLSVQQWDPYGVLDVDKTWHRCYGWAPSQKRQCRNLVAMANIEEAQRLLAKISQCNPSSDEIPIRLSQIAHCLLCRRNHQDQAPSVVGDWQKKINHFVQAMNDEGEQDSDITSEEKHTTSLQAQMAECQRLLTRVATALAEQQDAQLQFETSSIATDTSTETIQGNSVDEPEVPPSNDSRSEDENETEHPSTELNLGHVQSLVRQIDLEHEARNARRPRTVRFVDDNDPATAVAAEASPTASSQTLESRELNPEPHTSKDEQDREATASSSLEPQTETSEVEVERNQLAERPNPDTTVTRQPSTAQRLDLFGLNEVSTTDESLSPWSNRTAWWDNVWRNRLGHNQNSNPSCLAGRSQLARRHLYPVWLFCLFLYTGMVLTCFWLQTLHVGGASFLALEGSGFRQIGATAEGYESSATTLAIIDR